MLFTSCKMFLIFKRFVHPLFLSHTNTHMYHTHARTDFYKLYYQIHHRTSNQRITIQTKFRIFSSVVIFVVFSITFLSFSIARPVREGSITVFQMLLLLSHNSCLHLAQNATYVVCNIGI